MKLNNYTTLNDMGINSLHRNNNWLTHAYFCRKISFFTIADALQWKTNHEYEIINGNDIFSQIIDPKTRANLSIIVLVVNQWKWQ